MSIVVVEDLFTTSETCELLRCSRRTLVNLVARGRLAPVRVSARRNLFRRSDLERFVTENTNDDAEVFRDAFAFLAERQAEEDRPLCPSCTKRRVNRGANRCIRCQEQYELQLSHKRKWWTAHGSERRAAERKQAAATAADDEAVGE
jgi:excisionase family DNA binding protein